MVSTESPVAASDPTSARPDSRSAALPTRAALADRMLKDAILRGELAPGAKLVTKALADRFGVSPTPLREAIQRLAGIGLVEVVPQRGARVAPISVADVEEIYELRALLEPLAFEKSLTHADDAYRRDVAEAYDALTTAIADSDLVAVLDAHHSFHAALLARCPSRRLLGLVTQLGEHSLRYQMLAVAPDDTGRSAADDHAALRDAVAAGDDPRAVAVLRSHLARTLAAVRAHLDDG